MTVEPFVAAHLAQLYLQPAHIAMAPLLADRGYGEELEKAESYTAFVDGQVVACAGIGEIEAGRAVAWGLIGVNSPMVALTRATRRGLDACRFRRVEAYVDADFAPGHRWIQMLGFVDETPAGMREFRPGKTFHMYARTR